MAPQTPHVRSAPPEPATFSISSGVLQSPRSGGIRHCPTMRQPSSGGSMRRSGFLRTVLLLTLAVALTATTAPAQQTKPPVVVALVAAMSGGSALSGEAIKRGLTVAIDEINAKGGVLGGRKIELVIRDEEGNPGKGVRLRATSSSARRRSWCSAESTPRSAWRCCPCSTS